MMKKGVLGLGIVLFFFFGNAWAKEQAPLSFTQGDRIVGMKLALGSVFGSTTGLVVSGEYGLKSCFLDIKGLPNSLGIGGSFGYSSFFEFVFPWGNYFYRNYLFLGSAFWHVDIFKQKKIDTYLRANLGLNLDVITKPAPNAPGIESTYGGLVFGLSLGGRYYFNKNLAAAVELGFGMGNLRLGMDYRF